MSALQLTAVTALASTPVAGSGFAFSSYVALGDDLVGLAFQPGTGVLFATDEAGQLWSVPAGGGAATPVGAPFPKKPRGIAFGLDGRMYIARYDNGTSTGAGDVIEVHPATGAILRTVVSRGCVDGIATEPSSGDLLITSCRQMWRVVAPASAAPTIVSYAAVFNAHAIQISPSGQVFVNAPVNATSCVASCSNDRSEIWDVTGGTAQSVKNIPGTNGLALVGIIATPTGSFPHFVFTNSLAGDVQKVNLDTAGPNLPVLDADDGDVMTIGPDNCLYAIHDATVHRISKSDGTCDLETAGETVPAFELSAPGGTQHIGSPYTVTATLDGIGVDPATLVVLFDVTGANPQAGLVGTLIGGGAALGWGKWSVTYTGTTIGTDTVTARTVYAALPVTSDPLTVVWGPAADVTPPVVKVKVTGPHGPTGFACAALDAFVEISVVETCGFFTGAPTVQWQISEPESPATLTGICPTQTLNYPSPATGTPFTCSVGSEGGSTQKTVVLQAAPVAPEVTVIAKTASNAPYAPGTPTRETVTVEFTCKAAYGPPFMACVSAGATFSAPSLVIPPAPPGGCTAVACLPYTVVKATHTFAADGTFSASASASDATGRSDAEAFGTVVVDKTAPVVSATASRPPDLNGWYSADLTLTWGCADLGVVVTGCTVAAPVSVLVSAQGDLLHSKTAQDGVGNVGTGTIRVKLDKTAPTVTATATANGLPYVPGALTRHDVVVTFSCADNAGGSGIATCPAPLTVTSATPLVSATGTDLAGNVSAPATFGPIVIDNIPPTIAAAVDRGPDHNGWYTAPVTVTFTCSPDALACPSPSEIATDGADQSRSGTAADLAGNTSTATASGIDIDQQAPTISASVTPPANAHGWRNAPVSVTFACADQAGLSGIESCLGAATLGEGADQAVSGTATDVAGNTASLVVSDIDVDLTKPGIAASPDRGANADGWYNADVTVTFACADALSGIDLCPAAVTRGHGGGQVVAGVARDRAGNEESASVTLDIDTVAPSLVAFAPSGDPADGGRFALQATIAITGTDDLSGVRSVAYRSRTEPYADPGKTVLGAPGPWTASTTVSGATTSFVWTPEGRTTFEITITDRAGNTFTTTRAITIVHVIATQTVITSARTLRDGTIEVTATVRYLFSPALTVPAGRQVVFGTTPAGATSTAMTSASGVATATLARAPGLYTVTATFPEQLPFLRSDAASATQVAAAAETSFVIWGANAGGVQVGQRAQFWGAAWTKQVVGGRAAFRANSSFKGWGGTVTGASWSTKGGNTTEPRTVASYITVIITTATDRDGRFDRGNVAGYAVLRVEDPARYAANPGHDAYGRVIQTGP
ncbi:MAG TPA: hypothetical protein VFW12_05070 [Candidatus Limnocylindria bacterium]|nr:hypothetical protein [Candidatus Limnocylindria bacterium]